MRLGIALLALVSLSCTGLERRVDTLERNQQIIVQKHNLSIRKLQELDARVTRQEVLNGNTSPVSPAGGTPTGDQP